MKRWIPDLRSLSAQMILSFGALVLLTAAAAGLPAIWLIRGQLGRQAWAQVEQGSLVAQALYEAKQNELQSLATLTAQRPTLRELMAQGEQERLSAYLHTLQEGSGLDLVLVCNAGEQAVAHAGEAIPGDLCPQGAHSGFHSVPTEPSPRLWLLAAHPLDGEEGDSLGTVFVGLALDDNFAVQMRTQTGLEHTLLVDRQPVATSLTARQEMPCGPLDREAQNTFSVNGRPYYATCLPLDEGGLQAEMALDVTEVAATQLRLIWILIGSILAVAALASLLGIFTARRIGQPLTHLAEAADSMRQGDLDTPLTVEARVREVTLLAHALEGAREDLKRTLAELRREKAWTDHLLEAIVEGIVTLDRKGHITFFSHGAERITGWRRDEVIGQSCDQVFHPLETGAPFSQLMPTPGRREKISVELRDGRQAILAVTGARLLPPKGRDARVALVFRDVSEAEAVHRLLGHFLANVAHEFRTPLSALAASVELLLDQAPYLRAAELEELLTSLHLGVLGLQTLIDNLLESASIEAGHFRVHLRPSNLGEIIAAAIHTMQPLLDKHDQALVVELPAAIPVVRADPRRAAQVVVNLLSNASKYGPDESEIKIAAAVGGEWIRVTVADSGPGVPPEQRKDLFRRFVQPASGNDKAQVGAGLGLSVVKAIVEAHGGVVGVDDRADGGSTFWFTLPRADEG
ncbi:MAG: ATP-binding protein [Anaerolineae bacterium]|jgi:PAS domain S-box-containing protein